MADTRMIDKVKKATLCMTRQCWEQGVLAQALLEIQDYESLSLVARDMVLRQSRDGRLCNIENTPAVVDSSFCVGATLFAGSMQNDQQLLQAVEKNVRFLLNDAPRSPEGILYHMTGTKEIWADSAAFLPCAFALTKHGDEAVKQIHGIQAKLFDNETGLYFHIWDEDRQVHKRKLLWGVGNGWILTGLLRLYLSLPAEYRDKKTEIAAALVELLNVMLAYETKENLFHDILDDPQSFLETECAEMVAYTIYKSVAENLLDRAYLKKADAIRAAVHQKVDARGLVLDCASSPDFVRPGTSVEGQAHFLMMERAAENI